MHRRRAHRHLQAVLRLVMTLMMVVTVSGVTQLVQPALDAHGHAECVACNDDGGQSCEDHDEDCCGDECFGPVHHCACCSSVCAPAGFAAAVIAPAAARELGRPDDDRVDAAGTRARIDRPPRG